MDEIRIRMMKGIKILFWKVNVKIGWYLSDTAFKYSNHLGQENQYKYIEKETKIPFFLNIPASAYKVETSISEVLKESPYFHVISLSLWRKRDFSGWWNWRKKGLLLKFKPNKVYSILSQMYKLQVIIHLRKMLNNEFL